MAITPLSWRKPVGLAALAPAGLGLLLALWLQGPSRAGSPPTGGAVERGRETDSARWLASMEPLYPRVVPPPLHPLHKECIPAQDPPVYQRKTSYDFDDEVLEPDPFGPRVSERPRDSLPRGFLQSKAILEQRREELRQCYRWARYRDRSLHGAVRVQVMIDPFGAWSTPRVVPEMTGGAELAACVESVLCGQREKQVTPRNTEGQFRIRFVPSGQRRAPIAPVRPLASPPRAASGPACLLLPTPLPTDHLAPREPLLEIDDYDAEQARADDEFDLAQKLAAWQQGGKRGPEPMWPIVMPDSVGVMDFAAPPIRQSLRYNQGAYGACYVQALARHPGLAGRIVLGATVDPAGTLTVRVQESTVHDAEVEECMRKAMAEVWFDQWVQDFGKIEFTYPFVLKPAPVDQPVAGPLRDSLAGIEARAQAQLDQNDGNAALRSYSALVRQVPNHPRLCQWQVGALAATLRLAPWQEDERVLAAAKDLVSVLAHPTDPSAQSLRSACLDQAAPPLANLATKVHSLGSRYRLGSLLNLAIQRYQLVLGVGPDLPDADRLRFYMAEALSLQERYCEAAPIYVQVALGSPQGKKAKDAANFALEAGKRCLHLDAEDLVVDVFERLVKGR